MQSNEYFHWSETSGPQCFHSEVLIYLAFHTIQIVSKQYHDINQENIKQIQILLYRRSKKTIVSLFHKSVQC